MKFLLSSKLPQQNKLLFSFYDLVQSTFSREFRAGWCASKRLLTRKVYSLGFFSDDRKIFEEVLKRKQIQNKTNSHLQWALCKFAIIQITTLKNSLPCWPPSRASLIQTVDYRNVGPLNLFKKRSFWRCRLFSRSNDCYSVCFEPLIWDDETPRFVNCVHALTLLWTTRKFSQNRNLSSKSVHQSILIALPRTFANLIHCVALANSFKKTARVLW